MYIDISSIKHASVGKHKYWLLCVDEFTGFKKSFFLHMKDGQFEVLIDWFDELKSKYCIEIKYICCDNARQNKALQQELKKDGSRIQFEFTAPDMPQQNGIVECAFSYTYGVYKGYDDLCRF